MANKKRTLNVDLVHDNDLVRSTSNVSEDLVKSSNLLVVISSTMIQTTTVITMFLSSTMSGIAGAVCGAILNATAGIVGLIAGVINKIKEKVIDALAKDNKFFEELVKLRNKVIDWLTNLFKSINKWLINLGGKIKQGLNDFKEWAKSIWEKFKGKVKDWFNNSKLGKWYNETKSSLVEMFKNTKQDIRKWAIDKMWDIVDFKSTIMTNIIEKFEFAKLKVTGFTDKIGIKVLSELKKLFGNENIVKFVTKMSTAFEKIQKTTREVFDKTALMLEKTNFVMKEVQLAFKEGMSKAWDGIKSGIKNKVVGSVDRMLESETGQKAMRFLGKAAIVAIVVNYVDEVMNDVQNEGMGVIESLVLNAQVDALEISLWAGVDALLAAGAFTAGVAAPASGGVSAAFAVGSVVAFLAIPGLAEQYDNAKKKIKSAFVWAMHNSPPGWVIHKLDYLLEMVVSRGKIIKGFDWVDNKVDAGKSEVSTKINSYFDKETSLLSKISTMFDIPELMNEPTVDTLLEIMPASNMELKLIEKGEDSIIIEETPKTSEKDHATVIQDYKFEHRMAIVNIFGDVSGHKSIMTETRLQTQKDIVLLDAQIILWQAKIAAKKAANAAARVANAAARVANGVATEVSNVITIAGKQLKITINPK